MVGSTAGHVDALRLSACFQLNRDNFNEYIRVLLHALQQHEHLPIVMDIAYLTAEVYIYLVESKEDTTRARGWLPPHPEMVARLFDLNYGKEDEATLPSVRGQLNKHVRDVYGVTLPHPVDVSWAVHDQKYHPLAGSPAERPSAPLLCQRPGLLEPKGWSAEKQSRRLDIHGVEGGRLLSIHHHSIAK